MIDLLDVIENWFEEEQTVALATVIKTWGSSPRQAGAGMAISEDGRIAGSVSGGCVEGAVVDRALELIQTGGTARLHFGVADDEAWDVGLSCGGEIDIFVRIITQKNLETWKKQLGSSEPEVLALVLKGVENLVGTEIVKNDLIQKTKNLEKDTQEALKPEFQSALQERRTGIYRLKSSQIQETFIYYIQPAPELILVGGAHIAIPLAQQAKILGFEVIVIDPRRLFGTTERFPEVKKLISAWPEEAFSQVQISGSSAVVMLTHDPKIDDPALQIALGSAAFYIGALGSKKTHHKRLERLRALGLIESSLERIHAPVGLDLGAVTPEEIALSIMAEVLMVWRKGRR